ncbi:MAG TPA: polymer-forming cytoskeletal protein [Gemmatimonadales bacterium]|nr:polymer-forming cytoskeletal protein [Gemmatimonadales bacterium]
MRASSRLLAAALLALAPAPLSATVTPADLLREVWERLPFVSSDTVPRPAPRALPGGEGALEIRLDDVAHPITLERQIRDLASRAEAERRAVVPGGQAREGGFTIGSDQAVAGHVLVLDGDVDVHGRLDGNLVTFRGDVVVHPGAVVTGDVLALGGEVRALGEIAGETRTLSAPRAAEGPAVAPRSTAGRIALSLAGVAGVFLTLLLVGAGLAIFARGPLETVSDTVAHSFARSFVVGLLGQVLLLPTFGMLVVGLILTVAGILLLPFVVVVFAALLLASVVGGAIAVAHAMGETLARRQMARGVAVSPNALRYVATGLGAVALLWVVWAVFGWVPVAGPMMQGAAIIVTWLLASIGFGAALLSRGGLREQFAGRVVPPEMLTDEYLWATPRFGVPAAKRPDPGATPRSGTPRFPDRDR